jgi:hypothetical protein
MAGTSDSRGTRFWAEKRLSGVVYTEVVGREVYSVRPACRRGAITLIPAWAVSSSHSLTKSLRAQHADVLRSAFGSENADVIGPSLIRSDLFLEDGSKLCTLPIAEVDDDMKFRFQIAFGELASMRGKEILSTLKDMHRIVREIILNFDSQGLL